VRILCLAGEFLRTALKPPGDADVRYSDRFKPCWNDGPAAPNAISCLRYNTMRVPKRPEQIDRNHPPGADLKNRL